MNLRDEIAEKVKDILFDELSADCYEDGCNSVGGRDEAVNRIMAEIIMPLIKIG